MGGFCVFKNEKEQQHKVVDRCNAKVQQISLLLPPRRKGRKGRRKARGGGRIRFRRRNGRQLFYHFVLSVLIGVTLWMTTYKDAAVAAANDDDHAFGTKLSFSYSIPC